MMTAAIVVIAVAVTTVAKTAVTVANVVEAAAVEQKSCDDVIDLCNSIGWLLENDE